jgi:signal transduction histidine kinase
MAVLSVLCFLEVLVSRRTYYFAALAIHIGLCLGTLPLSTTIPPVELCVFAVVVVGICLHNPTPLNTVLVAAFVGAVLVVRGLLLATAGVSPLNILRMEIGFGLLAGLTAMLAAMMVHYRERLIDFQNENDRLDRLVERLTRANVQYQEYARNIEELTIETERKRITRDIHDIVGYTLTNNITMMEAITDIMRVNPLGVGSLVNAARENAEEGLEQIREALHILRSKEVAHPGGIHAVEKLMKVFERATGVHVEYAFSDLSWDFEPDIDSALYHVVQESLINSFRHGKASQIRIFLSRSNDHVVLKVRDDGIGADGFEEGIGLAGMRERLQKLGGSLRVGPIPAGFDVTARLPVAGGGGR